LQNLQFYICSASCGIVVLYPHFRKTHVAVNTWTHGKKPLKYITNNIGWYKFIRACCQQFWFVDSKLV